MASPIFTILSLFIFSCFVLSTPATCSSNETDLVSLLSFKNTVNDPQGALYSWNETTHFCSWNGIQCGRRHPNRVVAINLRSQDLMGTLTPHIGNLSFLRSINLQNNSFRGEIPNEIGRLRRLESVDFSNNSFIGAIPRNISQCPNLFYLNLIDNNLSGIIPQELGSLYKLEALGLSGNELLGPIPPSIGNLTSLGVLSLTLCGLTGEIPNSLVRLHRLTFLSLAFNNLVGTIPSGLFNISMLREFVVNRNQLQGSIPGSIGLTLPNLRIFYLGQNQLSGGIPMSLSNASSLERIQLTSNLFTGPIPRLGRLSLLSSLSIGDNPVNDDISFIASLTNCTNLERLLVYEIPLLGGPLPHSVVNFSSGLIELVISGTQVRGEIPSGIGNLVALNRLVLSNNDLEGPIPSDIGKLSSLQELFLEGNRFKNQLPSSLGNMTLLSYLYLQENNFSGNLPQSLSNCTKLLGLDLSSNNFSGLIPREIMSLSSISLSFNLSFNAFMGSIPSEIGSLTNVENLDFSNNRLSGLIPNSLSNCLVLQHLFLKGNLLQGEIPPGLSALRGLVELDLSRNNLSGTIPSFLAELHLQRLNLSYNGFHGEVPRTGLFRNRTAISLDGNKELCGGIPELNLPPCSSKTSSKKNPSSLPKVLIAVVISGGVFITFLVFLVLVLYRRRRPKENVASIESLVGTQFTRLSYGDLLKATNGLSEANLIGSGRFGSVYKGILEDHGKTLIAVKVLNPFVKGAFKSFMAECNALRDIRHRNLLKLLSVCESIDFQGNDFRSLIYDFKANGSLDKWLYHHVEQEGLRRLSLIQRLDIAIDVAHALEYLHFGTDSTIVHGDLKPSNILLDHNMIAYVGDFGLAKIVSDMFPAQESSSSIGIRGTIGYIAPEYGTSNLVSTQGDVYSYGVLLLEIFTNRRPTDDSFKEYATLQGFVSAALSDGILKIIDPLIQIENDKSINKITDCVVSVLSIGVACSKDLPRDRMSMTDVVRELHKIKDRYLSANRS
ncbi:probable LRR receptor-like serine/threonine-protein kinase At3g47570 [Sesamum indicum]|uniref:non-specific serine/threonine protein kinase n=1 Tax=Sesamum indicum TaxID=4182 RepID=A0A6I9UC50_SESIN|nr:probable LRR receptor-like serine/threonine-protein kinase At3g47570 [Sesamum indicum]